MRFLKIIPYFLCVTLAMALLGSILTTLSDYILCDIRGSSGDENVFQRLGIYWTIYFLFSFVTFFPLIIIFLSILQVKLGVKSVYILLTGVVAGALFGYLTQRSVFSLCLHSPEKEIRYILVIAISMMAFPYINKKMWNLFNRKIEVYGRANNMPFLKIILYFLLIMLALVISGSILTTISDYILCSINSEGCTYENVFERLGTYTLYYLFYSFVSFFFLIIIGLLLLQLKFRIKVIYIMLIGLIAGIIFSYFTQGLTMSLYTEDEKKLRYILVVSICMILFPFINKKLWEIVNKKTEMEIS